LGWHDRVQGAAFSLMFLLPVRLDEAGKWMEELRYTIGCAWYSVGLSFNNYQYSKPILSDRHELTVTGVRVDVVRLVVLMGAVDGGPLETQAFIRWFKGTLDRPRIRNWLRIRSMVIWINVPSWRLTSLSIHSSRDFYRSLVSVWIVGKWSRVQWNMVLWPLLFILVVLNHLTLVGFSRLDWNRSVPQYAARLFDHGLSTKC
jgi:hypothetical protein